MPLRFSIIVATLNRRELTLRALDSIRSQNWSMVEMIVVDGGSKDGTLEAISGQNDVILTDGPDRGVYDAFNKGIAKVTGDIVGLLNSDDLYEPGTFSVVANAFDENPLADAVCGTAILAEDGIEIARFADKADKILASPSTALIGSCVLNARFFRRETIKRIGPFRIDFHLVADRDWLTRWYEAGLTTCPIENVVYRYSQHPGSLTFDPDQKRQQAIYLELLRLARWWRENNSASTETRNTATMLEGRCIGRLAVLALSRGAIREALTMIFLRDGRVSLRPFTTLLRAAWDRLFNP